MKKILIALAVIIIVIIGMRISEYRHSEFLKRVDMQCKDMAHMQQGVTNDATTTKVWFDCMQNNGVKFYR